MTLNAIPAGEDRMMSKLMAVVEKLQQELFDVEKSRKEAETCARPCRMPSLTMHALRAGN